MTETELVKRLEKLEATIYAAQPVLQTITAHEFNVVDNLGRVRVRIGMVEGVPGIGLFDAQDNARVMIALTPEGAPAAAFMDAQGKSRMVIALTPEGAPNIGLLDAQGNTRAGMSINPLDVPCIGLSDAQGKLRALIGFSPEGEPCIGLLDGQEKTRAGIFVDSGVPSIELNDAKGVKHVEMLVNSSGSPSVKLSDADGFVMDLGRTDAVNLDTGAKAQTSAASIVMFHNDKERHVLWQAP
jgi:hypothetical protein